MISLSGKVAPGSSLALIIVTLFIVSALIPAGAPVEDGSDAHSPGTSIEPSPAPPPSTRAPSGPGYRSTYMWGENQPLITAAVAELDGDSPGDELVVAGEGERVVMLNGHHTSWEKDVLHKDNWWLYALDAGDLDPRRAGDEVVSSGWSDNVTMMYREDGEWKTHEIWTATDWVYNVAIGDIDPDRPGNELVVAGEGRSVHMIYIDGGDWTSKKLWTDDLYIDDLFLYDILPDNPGDEILVTGGSRNITMLAHDGDGALAEVRPAHNRTADGWWAGTMFNYTASETIALTAGQWGEAPAGDTPVSVLTCANDGSLIEASPDPAQPLETWASQKVWKDRETLYGLAMGDVDPRAEGDEVIAVGWSGNATVLRMDRTGVVNGDPWTAETAHEDDGPLSSVAVGDFDPWHPGLEFAVTTNDGDVHKVQYEKEGFGVFPSRDGDSVAAGGTTSIPLTVISRGGYSGQVSFTAPDTPDGFEVEFTPQTLEAGAEGTGAVVMTVNASADLDPGSKHVVKALGKDGTRETEASVTFTIMLPDAPDFTLGVQPPVASPNADFKASFSVSVGALGGFDEMVDLSLEGEVRGMTYVFAPSRVTPPATATLSITTSASTPLGPQVLTVVGQGGGLVHTAAVTLDVQVLEKPGFSMTSSASSYSISPNATVLIELNVQSLFGYNDSVSLDMTHDLPGVTASLSAWSVIPTANVTLNVTAGPELVPRLGSIKLTAEGRDGTTEKLSFSFELLEQGPYFYLEVDPTTYLLKAGGAAELKLNIHSVLGYEGMVAISHKGMDIDGASIEFSPIYAEDGSFPAGGSVRMTVYTSTTTEPGVYNLTLRGESGELVSKTWVVIEVLEPEDPGDSPKSSPWMGLTLGILIITVTIIMAINLRRGRGGKKGGTKGGVKGGEEQNGGRRTKMVADDRRVNRDQEPEKKKGG